MNDALKFLSATSDYDTPHPRKLYPGWLIHKATNEDLELGHDWVQWAFPLDTPSAFNWDAPTVTPEEMVHLNPMQEANLLCMAERFHRFLAETTHWHKTNDHNHLRITRVMRCLMMAGHPAVAKRFLELAKSSATPSTSTLMFWEDAVK